MQPTIYLEFSYTPDNYFEETLHEEKENYRLEIEGGKIKAILKESGNEKNSDFFDRIHKEIEVFFIAVQIVTHKKYILSRYAFFKEYPDGRKDKNVFTKSARLLLVESTADIKITKPDGIIIQDTKRERLEEIRFLRKLLIKYINKDRTVQKIVKSYDSAVNDPSNEFVHLYEIRDSFIDRFGGKEKVQANLGISKIEWDMFDDLTNNPQLRESRYRGKGLGPVRNATSAELAMARKFTGKLILCYLKLLDKSEVEPVI